MTLIPQKTWLISGDEGGHGNIAVIAVIAVITVTKKGGSMATPSILSESEFHVTSLLAIACIAPPQGIHRTR